MTLLPTYKLMLLVEVEVTFVFNERIYDLSTGHLRYWLPKYGIFNLFESDMTIRRTR